MWIILYPRTKSLQTPRASIVAGFELKLVTYIIHMLFTSLKFRQINSTYSNLSLYSNRHYF